MWLMFMTWSIIADFLGSSVIDASLAARVKALDEAVLASDNYYQVCMKFYPKLHRSYTFLFLNNCQQEGDLNELLTNFDSNNLVR